MKTKWFVLVPILILLLFAFALVSAEKTAWAQPPNQEIDCHPKKKVFLPLIVRPAEPPTPVPAQETVTNTASAEVSPAEALNAQGVSPAAADGQTGYMP
jgi:hypothetical protein